MSQAGGLPFVKLVGTGNDFLFLDFRGTHPSSKLSRSELVARIAHRHTGVGSDGVIFVESNSSGKATLKWDFYNPDGSRADMCGNALRCMGRWTEYMTGETQVTFLTARGEVTVRKQNDVFEAELTFVNLASRKLPWSISAGQGEAILVDTGVPHAVVEINSIDRKDAMESFIKVLRFHPQAGNAGANVTFLERHGDSKFRTVTFERGVEGYTLSCGTGVLAAAAVGLRLDGSSVLSHDAVAEMETPGGSLRVLFKEKLSAIHLIGPADVVCTGIIEERYLR